jgi:hypothetical protein
MRWVEEWTKAQAWGCPYASPQEISKKYKHQSLGMPPRHPFFIGKSQVTFQNTIFLLLHAVCVSLGASVVLVFIISFVLFAAINGWSHHVCGERHAPFFICQEHSSFHSYRLTSVLFFCYCRFHSLSAAFHFPGSKKRFLPVIQGALACIFCLDFCSDLVISLHQGVFWPLVHVGFPQKSWIKKVWMVLEKRKSFMQKSGTRRSLCRLRFRLLHVVLDVILMVCLVVFL